MRSLNTCGTRQRSTKPPNRANGVIVLYSSTRSSQERFHSPQVSHLRKNLSRFWLKEREYPGRQGFLSRNLPDHLMREVLSRSVGSPD
jgi:hypothetical protein